MTKVIDASAILGLLLNERRGAGVIDHLDDAVVSAVNYAEVISKLAHTGMPTSIADYVMTRLRFTITPFTRRQALLTGELRPRTAHLGFSLGDRACLATALDLATAVVTLDRAWTDIDLGIPVILLG